MSKLTRLVSGRALAMALAALAGLTATAPAHAEDPPGDAANGRRIFLADGCFLCHGRSGQGGALNYPVPALAGLEMPVDSFIAFLREAPNDMPAYSTGVLSDQEARDIHAFLRALPGRRPAKDIPLLNP